MLKKTLIRKHLTALLKRDLTIVESRVYAGRIHPYSADGLYPALSIYNRDDLVEDYYTDHTERSTPMQFIIAVKENDPSKLIDYDFDEVIENAQLEVQKILSRIVRILPLGDDPFDLIEELQLIGSNTSYNDTSEDNIGFATINYNIIYKVVRPDGLVVLEDFDLEDSLLHLDIIQLDPLKTSN